MRSGARQPRDQRPRVVPGQVRRCRADHEARPGEERGGRSRGASSTSAGSTTSRSATPTRASIGVRRGRPSTSARSSAATQPDATAIAEPRPGPGATPRPARSTRGRPRRRRRSSSRKPPPRRAPRRATAARSSACASRGSNGATTRGARPRPSRSAAVTARTVGIAPWAGARSRDHRAVTARPVVPASSSCPAHASPGAHQPRSSRLAHQPRQDHGTDPGQHRERPLLRDPLWAPASCPAFGSSRNDDGNAATPNAAASDDHRSRHASGVSLRRLAVGARQPREGPGTRHDPVHVVPAAAGREPPPAGPAVRDRVDQPGRLRHRRRGHPEVRERVPGVRSRPRAARRRRPGPNTAASVGTSARTAASQAVLAGVRLERHVDGRSGRRALPRARRESPVPGNRYRPLSWSDSVRTPGSP